MKALVGLLMAGVFLSSCSQTRNTQSHVWSLYRNSVTDPSMRIHIATFDSADDDGSVAEKGMTYNAANCEVARGLFQAQDGIAVKFWCEQGRAH